MNIPSRQTGRPDKTDVSVGMLQLRQQDEYKLAGIKSGNMDDIMSAVGHGMMKLIKDTKTQACFSQASRLAYKAGKLLRESQPCLHGCSAQHHLSLSHAHVEHQCSSQMCAPSASCDLSVKTPRGFYVDRLISPLEIRMAAVLQADLHNLPKDAGIDPGTVSPEIPAYRFTSPAASEQLLRPPSRKELAYTGHLDRVHQ